MRRIVPLSDRRQNREKIIVLANGNIYERRGFFNAVVSRTKHLQAISDYDIDVLLLSTYEPWLVRKLRHTQKCSKPSGVEIDGVKIQIRWCRFSLIDYLLETRLNKGPFFKKFRNERLANSIRGYDFIIAHSTECGLIAKRVKKIYGTPYSITWHGSDIHTLPFRNSTSFKDVKSVIEDADVNFFVSKVLLETSQRITISGNKMVLYNGYSESFKKYPEIVRLALRQKYDVVDKKVVVFAGGFLAVKNILIIPLIFKKILEKSENVECWMIGGGKYFHEVEGMVKGLSVRLWGNQEPENMPDFFNSSDVLILPSFNEGLPLTVVEALACGCNVVGSLVGGIPEVIGKDACVDLNDPLFVDKFAEKVVDFLEASPHIEQTLDPKFDWNRTARIELNTMQMLMSHQNETN